MGSCIRSGPQILVALPALARAAVIAGHEYKIPRSYLGRPNPRGESQRGQRTPARQRSRPRGGPRRSARVVVADGGIRRAGAAVADGRAMPQRRLRLAAGEMPSLRDRGQHSARTRPPAARHANLEAGGGVEMPIMPETAILAAGQRKLGRLCFTRGCIRTMMIGAEHYRDDDGRPHAASL